jgi:hypothetical protein
MYLSWCLAALTGLTREEVNTILIFCLLWPAITLGLLTLCLRQLAKIRRLLEKEKRYG